MKTSIAILWYYITFLYWKSYYLFYKPKTKGQIIKKWARLNYYDFKELNMVLSPVPFSEMKGNSTNENK